MNGERKQKIYSKICLLLIIALGIVFCFSIVMVLRIYINGKTEAEEFCKLKEELLSDAAYAEADSKNTNGKDGEDIADQDAEIEKNAPFSDYAEYCNMKNADCVGWINVQNTEINYPVMLSSTEPEFYLHHSFSKAASKSGTPFIGVGGTPECSAFVIFSHNMKNNTMFGTLDYYCEEEFFNQNGSFIFATPDYSREYKVFAVLKCEPSDYDEDFRYYEYSGDLSKEDFEALSNWLTQNSLYDTGKVPKYGEQIVMLSTCSYHTKGGILIVAGVYGD